MAKFTDAGMEKSLSDLQLTESEYSLFIKTVGEAYSESSNPEQFVFQLAQKTGGDFKSHTKMMLLLSILVDKYHSEVTNGSV